MTEKYQFSLTGEEAILVKLFRLLNEKEKIMAFNACVVGIDIRLGRKVEEVKKDGRKIHS